MRFPALVVIVTVSIGASQLPVMQSQPAIQPSRDVIKRAGPSGTARIRGRVVTADRGTPMRRATVTLTEWMPPTALPGSAGAGITTGSMPPRSATTGNDGQFEFAALPAGSYRVLASPARDSSQYLSMPYGAKRPSGPYWAEPGQSIDLKDGQVADTLVIALSRGAIITGRVMDENGEPLAEVPVYTLGYASGVTRGQRSNTVSRTDDLGQFRLWGLSAGEYVVVADGQMLTPPSTSAPPETEEARLGYVTTYYPGTIDESSAQRLRVKAGEETKGIDIRIAQAKQYRISGSVVDSSGKPVAGGTGQLMRRAADAASQLIVRLDPKGQFQVRNVPPGEYRFTFRPAQANVARFSDDRNREPVEMASVKISIGDADIDKLMIATSLGVTISGRVVFEQAPPTTSQNPMTVRAVPENFPGVLSPTPATIGDDGRFTLKGLMGENALRVSMPDQYIKSVTVGADEQRTIDLRMLDAFARQ